MPRKWPRLDGASAASLIAVGIGNHTADVGTILLRSTNLWSMETALRPNPPRAVMSSAAIMCEFRALRNSWVSAKYTQEERATSKQTCRKRHVRSFWLRSSRTCGASRFAGSLSPLGATAASQPPRQWCELKRGIGGVEQTPWQGLFSLDAFFRVSGDDSVLRASVCVCTARLARVAPSGHQKRVCQCRSPRSIATLLVAIAAPDSLTSAPLLRGNDARSTRFLAIQV